VQQGHAEADGARLRRIEGVEQEVLPLQPDHARGQRRDRRRLADIAP